MRWRDSLAKVKSLGPTLWRITRHPLSRDRPGRALLRFARWQLASRLASGPIAVPFVNDTRLLVSNGMSGATGNVYCGLHEYEEMAFALHVLRPGDLFVDVGANVGSYTVLAASTGASCVAIEPVSSTFGHLMDNVRLNHLESSVECLNVAVGSTDGTVRFTGDLDAVNHVVTDDRSQGSSVEIPVRRLDNVLARKTPAVIKIDVEGFESEVLAGADGVFGDRRPLAVIMELNGSGARYGIDDESLREAMRARGFSEWRYRPGSRELVLANEGVGRTENAIFVSDVEGVGDRLASAVTHRVLGRQI